MAPPCRAAPRRSGLGEADDHYSTIGMGGAVVARRAMAELPTLLAQADRTHAVRPMRVYRRVHSHASAPRTRRASRHVLGIFLFYAVDAAVTGRKQPSSALSKN